MSLKEALCERLHTTDSGQGPVKNTTINWKQLSSSINGGETFPPAELSSISFSNRFLLHALSLVHQTILECFYVQILYVSTPFRVQVRIVNWKSIWQNQYYQNENKTDNYRSLPARWPNNLLYWRRTSVTRYDIIWYSVER